MKYARKYAFLRGAVMACIVLVCFAFLLSAEEEPLRRVDPIWVRAGPDYYPYRYSFPGSALERGVSISTNGNHLRDILGRAPGVLLQESFGGIDVPRLSVRGSGIQSAPVSRGLDLLWNGFPLNFADGSFNLAVVEGSWVNAVTTLNGTAAGVPQMGGRLSLEASGSSIGEKGRGVVRHGSGPATSGFIEGKTGTGEHPLIWGGALAKDDGWRAHSRQQRESAQLLWGRSLGENYEWVMQLYAARPRIEVPGPLSLEMAQKNPQANAPPVLRDKPRRNTEYVLWGNRLSYTGERMTGTLSMTGIVSSDEFRQLLPNGIQKGSGLDLHLEAGARFPWQGNLHEETAVDLRISLGRRDVRRYRNEGGLSGALIGDHRYSPSGWMLNLAHHLKPWKNHRWEWGLGLYSSKRELREMQPAVLPGPDTTLGFRETHVAPRLIWEWSPVERQKWTLSWSMGAEAPNLEDILYTSGPMNERILNSRRLYWQKAETGEVAWRGAAGRFTWGASLYASFWKGELLRLADEEGASRGVVNADRTRHHGGELSFDLVLWEGVDSRIALWSNYHYSQVRFEKDPVYGNRRLGGIPPHFAKAGLTVELFDGWQLVPTLDWRAGKTYADHANTLFSGGSTLWSIHIARRWKKGWHTSVDVSNLTDRKAIASTAGVLEQARQDGGDLIFLPASGRRLEARIEIPW